MKIRAFIIAVFALAIALFTHFDASSAEPGYSARQITPRPGQVLFPGQVVKVQWTANIPHVQSLNPCEAEVFLSLDGGRNFIRQISPWLGAKDRSFYWTVPNTPTNEAVLNFRFGCELLYPESYSPQLESMFVIAKAPDTD